jgi:hypothetical protein
MIEFLSALRLALLEGWCWVGFLVAVIVIPLVFALIGHKLNDSS